MSNVDIFSMKYLPLHAQMHGQNDKQQLWEDYTLDGSVILRFYSLTRTSTFPVAYRKHILLKLSTTKHEFAAKKHKLYVCYESAAFVN